MDILKIILQDQELAQFVKELSQEQLEDNLCLLLSQANSNARCLKCLGKKECLSEVNNMQSRIYKQQAIIGQSYYPCSYKNIQNDDNLEILYLYDNFDEKDLYINEKRSTVFKVFQDYDNHKGIYLHGSFGVGKSHLLMTFAKQLAKKGKRVIYAYYPELVRKAKSAIGDGSLEKLIVRLKNIDVLMLDDIGGEMNSAFIRDEFLGPILQYRMLASLPVFMTSNYDPNKLKEHFSGTKDESNPLKAARLIERIGYMMNVIELKDQNYRK